MYIATHTPSSIVTRRNVVAHANSIRVRAIADALAIQVASLVAHAVDVRHDQKCADDNEPQRLRPPPRQLALPHARSPGSAHCSKRKCVCATCVNTHPNHHTEPHYLNHGSRFIQHVLPWLKLSDHGGQLGTQLAEHDARTAPRGNWPPVPLSVLRAISVNRCNPCVSKRQFKSEHASHLLVARQKTKS